MVDATIGSGGNGVQQQDVPPANQPTGTDPSAGTSINPDGNLVIISKEEGGAYAYFQQQTVGDHDDLEPPIDLDDLEDGYMEDMSLSMLSRYGDLEEGKIKTNMTRIDNLQKDQDADMDEELDIQGDQEDTTDDMNAAADAATAAMATSVAVGTVVTVLTLGSGSWIGALIAGAGVAAAATQLALAESHALDGCSDAVKQGVNAGLMVVTIGSAIGSGGMGVFASIAEASEATVSTTAIAAEGTAVATGAMEAGDTAAAADAVVGSIQGVAEVSEGAGTVGAEAGVAGSGVADATTVVEDTTEVVEQQAAAYSNLAKVEDAADAATEVTDDVAEQIVDDVIEDVTEEVAQEAGDDLLDDVVDEGLEGSVEEENAFDEVEIDEELAADDDDVIEDLAAMQDEDAAAEAAGDEVDSVYGEGEEVPEEATVDGEEGAEGQADASTYDKVALQASRVGKGVEATADVVQAEKNIEVAAAQRDLSYLSADLMNVRQDMAFDKFMMDQILDNIEKSSDKYATAKRTAATSLASFDEARKSLAEELGMAGSTL